MPGVKRKRSSSNAGTIVVYGKPASSSSKRRKRSSGSSSSRRGSGYAVGKGEPKYVDGYLDNIIVTELATNDVTWAGTEFNPRQATAVYGCLPVPRQGNNYADRDGKKIFINNIRINGKVIFPAFDIQTVGLNSAPVRIIIVKDTRTNGLEVVGEEVIGPGRGSDGNASLSADAALYMGTNPNGWGKYQIMASKIINVPSALTSYHDGVDAGFNGVEVPFSFTIKAKCGMMFNGSPEGVVNNIVDNSFSLLAACGPTGGTTPTISYTARTSFTG